MLADLVATYLEDCRARNLSERTISQDYAHVLSLLLEAVGNIDERDVTTEALRRYVVHLRDRDKYAAGQHPWMQQREGETLSKWTVHQHVKSLKTFFNWASNRGYLDTNPAAGIAYPKKPQGRIETYSRLEVWDLLDAAAEMSYRDYAIVYLLLDTGLRRSEVCDLTQTDININAGFLDVHHGKGDKARRVAFGAQCQTIQWTYNTRHRKPAPGVQAFYLSQDGTGLSYDGLGMVLKRLDDKLPFRVFAHKCRHTYGTNLARQGHSEFEIAHLLGHNNTNTARLYVHLAQQDRIDASPMDEIMRARPRNEK